MQAPCHPKQRPEDHWNLDPSNPYPNSSLHSSSTLPEWKFLNGRARIMNSTPGHLPVPEALKPPIALQQP